jgi:hypothetical protein
MNKFIGKCPIGNCVWTKFGHVPMMMHVLSLGQVMFSVDYSPYNSKLTEPSRLWDICFLWGALLLFFDCLQLMQYDVG